MLAALTETDVRPNLMVGTSVGAANAVWFVLHPSDVDSLASLWLSLRRTDVLPTRPVRGLLGLLGFRDHLVPNSGLRRLLERWLGEIDLTGTEIPVHVGATDVLTGAEVLLSKGSAVDEVLASTAIPAVFPPLHLDGRYLMDGGAVNHSPVSHAVELGATWCGCCRPATRVADLAAAECCRYRVAGTDVAGRPPAGGGRRTLPGPGRPPGGGVALAAAGVTR
ncbi:patatin-like phospholipase [Lentzea atacamensis]|uniref:Patatin-like phospholipase n=2 Tax=Lentzea atacamensis TaxID=531938 RepID=A0A316HTJ5_9PSEU|nr:patatin-like phospholipase [Lentzea atacamensis]